jgi:sarcosine oxidase subunit beta
MFSPRGVMMLAQTQHEVRGYKRTAEANALQGVQTEFISPARVKELCPIIHIEGPRYPVLGRPLAGPRRHRPHDAVAWGYARACADMGMDIIEQCEVKGVTSANGSVTASRPPGRHRLRKLAIVVAGHSSCWPRWRASASHRIPPLQALVSEPDQALHGRGRHGQHRHGYMSQSDKGEMVIGGGTDGYNAYTQRGSFHHIEETSRPGRDLPIISRLKMLRQWGGIVDMTGDRSPILSKTPLGNCFVNCGWGTGGFKAIPGSGWAMAELVAKGEPGPLAAEFGLDRFREGRFIDESVAAGVAH